MNVKFLAFAAIAASMTLVACNKEVTPEEPGVPKSVTIKLANVVPGTRSADAPVADNSQVTLKDFQVFFTDGTTLYKGQSVDGGATAHYFTTMSEYEGRTDEVFHFLPAAVNKVIVIGNLGGESQATTVAELQETLSIAEQQDDAALYLYAEAPLTSSTGYDDAGHPLYTATVTLAPRVSRVEIASFTYSTSGDPAARKYTDIEISQVLLGNYYESANSVSGAVSGALTRPKTAVDEGTAFGILDGAATGWFNDEFATGATLTPVSLNATSNYTHSYGTDAVRPAYHFFPNASNIGDADCPQLLIRMVGTDASGNKVPLYLATQSFTPAVTADFAKIYTISFEFDDEDMGDPEKCVDVTVQVTSWDVVAVTPNF